MASEVKALAQGSASSTDQIVQDMREAAPQAISAEELAKSGQLLTENLNRFKL